MGGAFCREVEGGGVCCCEDDCRSCSEVDGSRFNAETRWNVCYTDRLILQARDGQKRSAEVEELPAPSVRSSCQPRKDRYARSLQGTHAAYSCPRLRMSNESIKPVVLTSSTNLSRQSALPAPHPRFNIVAGISSTPMLHVNAKLTSLSATRRLVSPFDPALCRKTLQELRRLGYPALHSYTATCMYFHQLNLRIGRVLLSSPSEQGPFPAKPFHVFE